MHLLQMPPEIILVILEALVVISPFTLLMEVPRTSSVLRALCSRVRGDLSKRPVFLSIDAEVRSRSGMPRTNELCLRRWKILFRRLLFATTRHFPLMRGLWTSFPKPLHTAVSGPRARASEFTLRRLLGAADAPTSALRVKDLQYQTPLTAAAKWGDTAAVRCLIDHGASPSDTNGHGHTALEVAIRYNQPEVITMLS